MVRGSAVASLFALFFRKFQRRRALVCAMLISSCPENRTQTGVHMNTSKSTDYPASDLVAPGATASIRACPLPPTVLRWLKRLFACNPFYLTSAALLLYGVYRVSNEGGFLGTEMRQLVFNYSSLQLYEILVVLTAGWLVLRRIWYDAALLVTLENLFWIVPFVLVSQAAFIAPDTGRWLCGLALVLVAARVVWLRWRAAEIMPTAGVLWCGLPLLLANAIWPVLYRHFGENKVGINIASGAAYAFNEFNWFWLLPMLAAGVIVLPPLPPAAATGPRRPWFPVLWFACWLVGSEVHLYSLGYVYDFPLRREQAAPVLVLLTWGIQLRLTDFVALKNAVLRQALLFLPLLATTPALLVTGSRTFLYLSVINTMGYGALLLRSTDRPAPLQLMIASLAATAVSLPIDFAQLLNRPLSPVNLLALAFVIYITAGGLFSRRPRVALAGAGAALLAGGLLRHPHADYIHWAFQLGCGYCLAHSLRWRDADHPGAGVLRYAVALIWVLHGAICARRGVGLELLLTLAMTLGAVWTIRCWLGRRWKLWIIPGAAVSVALGHPINLLLVEMKAAPAGLLYVLGSFVLFGVGTLAALIKHRGPHLSKSGKPPGD
jgi:hypothetical protein